MTSFNQPAPGTESSVPVAGTPQPNPAQVAALQSMWAAMNSLAQAQGPPLPLMATPVATPATPAPTQPVTLQTPPLPAAPCKHRFSHPWSLGRRLPLPCGPVGPLMPIAEEDQSERIWYCITRGLYVGITLNNPLALTAVIGVSGGAMKGHKTQSKALAAFNECWPSTWFW
ncbi:hypothetical protein B0H13DRAFT_2331943 [Mycena leptocephala]|nr:hypothetical protein B0H13DRAFT_2331943 [Mycena leptocephala]